MNCLIRLIRSRTSFLTIVLLLSASLTSTALPQAVPENDTAAPVSESTVKTLIDNDAAVPENETAVPNDSILTDNEAILSEEEAIAPEEDETDEPDESEPTDIKSQLLERKDDFPIEVNADNVEYIKEQEIVKGTGNVVINFKGVRLAADSITVNLLTKDANAVGNVRFFQGDSIYTAERVTYNFQTEKGRFTHTKGKHYPFYFYGETVTKEAGSPEYHIENGYVTTSDYRIPDYKLKSKSVHIYPRDKVVMKDIIFEIGRVPVFWFPFWYYPLKEKESPVSIVPGYSKKWGFYLLNSAQIYQSENLEVTIVGDYRSKRGMAGGVDADYNFENRVRGELKTYFMRDKNFEKFDQDKLSDDTDLEEIEKDRYRVTLLHEQKISPSTRLLGQLNLQSDRQIIDDFFPREFEEQIQRVNFLDITNATNNYQLEFYLSPRLNSFFDVLERMPEVRFLTRDKRIGTSPIYFQTDMQVADLNFKFDNEDLNYESFRWVWLNEASIPMYLCDFLNVVPYVQGNAIYYSNYRNDVDEDLRGVAQFGIRNSFKTSKIYGWESTNWNIHGIRHIFEPTVDFKVVRSNVNVNNVLQFDPVDAMVHDTAVSFRFRNLFQTKRWNDTIIVDKRPNAPTLYTKGIEEVTKDLIDFSVRFDVFPTKANRDTFAIGHANPRFKDLDFVDFLFRRNVYLGSPYVQSFEDKYLSELLFDLKFSPFDWLSTTLMARFDPHDQSWEEVTYGLSFFNSDKVSWDIYTSYYQGGSTQLSHTVSYRINTDWRLRISHILDFNRDSTDSILEYQRYTIVKDLHEWELAFSYSDRRYFRERDVVDRSIFVMVYLKDFPNVQLKLGN